MSEQYTIGRLARLADVPVTTVRYYERIGLILPEDRSGGNYRLYGESSLRRLRFIRAAQAIGLSLDDVKRLLGAGDRSPRCGQVRQLIEERLEEIDRRWRDLQEVRQVLTTALAQCRTGSPRAACRVLKELSCRDPS
ncbi:MAG: heavy metal-responsive transcriptional regulator [Pirellulaceae bacterium]|nr:MAG: heavy metal-responsive transcriptional regulator [Pirellulaceae bacterium]